MSLRLVIAVSSRDRVRDRGCSEWRRADRDHRPDLVDRLDDRRRHGNRRSAWPGHDVAHRVRDDQRAWVAVRRAQRRQRHHARRCHASSSRACRPGPPTPSASGPPTRTGSRSGRSRRSGPTVGRLPGCDHRRGEPDRAVPRARLGNRRSERRRDRLVRRFRDDHVVRVTDDSALGRERVVGGRCLGRPHRAPVGNGLQLPLRCRRRWGNVARREPHLPHRPRARRSRPGRCGTFARRRPVSRAPSTRNGRSATGWFEYGIDHLAGNQDERARGGWGGRRGCDRRDRDRSPGRLARLLPRRRPERRGDDQRRHAELPHLRRPDRRHRCRFVDSRQRGNGWRHRQSEWARNELVVRVGPDQLATVNARPPGNAGSGTATVNVTAQLTGLPVATTVFFRLVAESSGGRIAGSGVSFRTATPPSAVTGKVTEWRSRGRRSTAAIDPAGSATSWWFEYGRSPSLGRRTGVGTVQPGASTGVASAAHRAHRRRALLVQARRGEPRRTIRRQGPLVRDGAGAARSRRSSAPLHDRRHGRARRPPRHLAGAM